MPIDVAQELGGGELAAHHVTFELGHVYAVGREPPERLVQSGGHVPHPEHEGRHHVRVGGGGLVGARRHDQEPRGVVRCVFDIGAQDLKPVDLGRQRGGDRRVRLASPFGDELRRPGGVGLHHRHQPHVLQQTPHLAKRHGVRVHTADVANGGALHAEQAVLHPLEVLGNHKQTGLRQQVVDVGHPASEAVLARQHGECGRAVMHRLHRRLEAGAGQRGHPGIRGAARQVGVGAGQALERDGARHRFGSSSLRARSRSAGVSTPNGAWSTRAHAIRIPASSARSCSSFSRRSSGLSGSVT